MWTKMATSANSRAAYVHIYSLIAASDTTTQ